jgi:hypothetical protein
MISPEEKNVMYGRSIGSTLRRAGTVTQRQSSGIQATPLQRASSPATLKEVECLLMAESSQSYLGILGLTEWLVSGRNRTLGH